MVPRTASVEQVCSALTTEDLDGSLVDRFRRVAAELPDFPAFASPGATMTFAEADARSDDIARLLLASLGHGDEPVATLLDQSVTGLVALLAGLKTGRPVVPLDPLVPTARLAQIVARAGACACLADAAHHDAATELAPAVNVIIDVDSPAPGAGPPAVPAATGNDVAVIVFTSGSTGAPKGVVWTHATLLNEAYAGFERLGFAPGDRTALVLPHSFAAGLTVVFFALLNGAGVYAYDPRTIGVRDLPAWIDDQRLTTIHMTPSLLRSLLGALEPGHTFTDLRLVTTCGEPVHGRDVTALRKHLPADCTFANWSGASEIGSLAFFSVGPNEAVPEGVLPAGKPAAGKQILLIDEDGAPVTQGETGEVVVVSSYLSAGYWRPAPEAAGRFTLRPDGRTAYRTGDLGRFDTDGDLFLLGRRDAAVKIRGYLVEPSEVESALLSLDDVADAVVVAISNPPAANRLVAYVVPAATGATLSAAAIRRLLRVKLPAWMVPTTIVGLSELPRNERGKVDRTALPAAPAGPRTSAPPRSQWEIVVADLWTKVLDLEEVGVDDDFMELGGDSLAVEELLSSVSEKLGVMLPSSALVEAPTLSEFAHRVAHAPRAAASHPTVVPLRTGGTRPPLFCFAGAGGLGLGFVSLARRLGDDQPVYAFQAHGLERRGIPDWTVERTARRHLQMIRVLRPRGPYALAGHSLGGLIAMEIARQLAAAGEEVGLLVLLDTYLPTATKVADVPSPSTSGPRSVMAAAAATGGTARAAAATGGTATGGTAPGPDGQYPPSVRPVRPTEVTRDYAAKLRQSILAQVRALLPQRLPRFSTLVKAAQLPLAGLVRYPGLVQFDVFFNHGRLLERFYSARPWPGRTLVYRAQDNPDDDNAWSSLLSDYDVHDIACEHFSMLREPHVDEISKSVAVEIDKLVPTAAVRRRTG